MCWMSRPGTGRVRRCLRRQHRLSDIDEIPCGERARPALGCEAAQKPAATEYLIHRIRLIGAASQPSAGLARSPQGSSSVSESCVDTYAAMAVCLPAVQSLDRRHRGQARAYTGLRMRISSETPTLSNRAVLPLANASTPSCSVSPANCAAMFITSASREYTPPSRE